MDSDVPASRCGTAAAPTRREAWLGPDVRTAASPPGSAHEAVVTEDGAAPFSQGEPTAQHDTGIILGGRATSLPFTAVLSGSQRITTDNARAAWTCTVLSHRRSQSRPIWLWEQGVADPRSITAKVCERPRSTGCRVG
jgi:hypothetical protein